MTQARLVVTLPEGPWVGEVSRDHPSAVFRVLAVLPGAETGYALVGIESTNVGSILDEMRAHPSLVELSVLASGDDEATVQFETDTPLLVRAAKEAGVPLRMPIEIVDGKATLSVVGANDDLSRLAEQLEGHGFDYRVDRVRDWSSSDRILTDRQRQTVLAAVESGYYDTPRRCSLTELADELGLAKSTVSETLHRAEGTVVKSFLAEQG